MGDNMKRFDVKFIYGNAYELELFTCACGNTCDTGGFYAYDPQICKFIDCETGLEIHACGDCNCLYKFITIDF